MQNSSLLENSVKTESIFRNYLNKMLNTLNVFNTRILLHCVAAIVATFLVSWFQIKPYGVLFIILLVFWVYKTRCAASIKIIPPPELNEKIINVYDKLLKLRKERPAIFCAIITSVLGILAIIGHLLSGSNVVIFGLILAALVSTKYNFKILKVPNKERLSWVDLTNDNEVDEFLPEVNDSNLFVLQRASDQAVIATATTASSADYAEDDEKNDEIPSELLLPDSIPEIDENSESSSEDELIPKLSDVNQKKNQNKELTEEITNLEFKRGYFKKDSSISTSSSSDDESLSKGLNFNEYTVVDGNRNDNQRTNRQNQQQQSVAVISSAAGAAVTILPNLMTGLISSLSKSGGGSGVSNEQTNKISSDKKQLNAAAMAADTSDESDFEILNTEDLNNP